MPRRIVIALALLLASSSCSLYFGEELPPEDDDPRPPRPVEPLVGFGRCEDGALYHLVIPDRAGDQPVHGTGAALGRCGDGCRSAVIACSDAACSNAAEALCEAPPARGVGCALEGSSCTGGGTVDCPQVTACSGTLPGATCTCDGSAYACTPDADLAAVHASLVGKWRGSVDPPDFSAPYDVSLWIYPDGTYWAECVGLGPCTAFYYGGDGPHPARRISVSAATPTGAHAEIGLFEGQQTGALSDLRVQGDTLTFTFRAIWQSCQQPFYFTLTRA